MELINCIDRIPKSLEDIIEKYGYENIDIYNHNFSNINIIGSGSSYNAGKVAQYFLRKYTGCECRVILPSDLIYDLNSINFSNDELFIFVSQGGNTKLVLDSLLKLKKINESIITLTITENLEGTIAKNADYSIDMLTYNEEFIYRTLGFSCSAFILCLLGLRILKKDIAKYIIDAKKVISNLSNIKQISKIWFKENQSKFEDSSTIVLIGTEILYEVLNEIKLKIMEMVPKICICFELEESIHGPHNCFDDTMMFLMLNNEYDKGKNIKIKSFIENEVTKNVASIGKSEDVDINSIGKYFYFLEYTCFMQYVSYYYSKLNNRNLTEKIYPELDNYIKKVV